MPFAFRTFSLLSENIRGSLYMMASMFAFAFNDLIIKSFGQSIGLGQIVLLRGLFACFVILVLLQRFSNFSGFRNAIHPLVLVRAAMEACATFFFVTAIFHIPIADATAILQFLPLSVTLGAAYFFGEKIGWRRFLAIISGFIGVLIILKPGMSGFNTFSIYALISVISCTVRDLVTRRLPGEIRSIHVTMISIILVTMFGGTLSLFEEWQAVSFGSVGFLALASLFILSGNFFSVTAMRVGEIGFVSPFRYTILLFAIVGGIVLFGEIPDRFTITGAMIVVCTGIYTLYRERFVRRQAINLPPAKS
jgi:drug/metabolite transporter (DMT)-like permease